MPTDIQEYHKEDFVISTDRTRLNIPLIHGVLSQTYWAWGIPLETVSRSIDHSLCFGIYHNDEQVGFARVITDFTTFAWVGDVFVVEAWRGRELGKWLMECIMAHPELQNLRRWLLATKDAHGLYSRYGFAPLPEPQRFMIRLGDFSHTPYQGLR